MIIWAFFLLAAAYIGINLALVVIRNYRSQNDFRRKAPDFKYVEGCSVFTGNLLKVIKPHKNVDIIDEYHKKLGNSFGLFVFDKMWVLTKDLDLIKIILKDKGGINTDKHFLGSPFNAFNNSVLQIAGEDWRRARKALTNALTNHKIRGEGVTKDMEACAKKLSDGLAIRLKKSEAETGKRCLVLEDTYDTIERYSLSVIFLVAYKKENMINFVAEKDYWCELLDEGLRDISNPLVYLAMGLPFIRPIFTFASNFRKIGQMQNKIQKYLVKNVSKNEKARQEHLLQMKNKSTSGNLKEVDFSNVQSQGKFTRKIADSLIDAFIEKQINYTEMVSNLLFLFLVGFETSTTTATYLFWSLAFNPEIQEKLRKTIDEEGMDADYVVWCIYEAIRLHPAVPLGGGRILAEDIIHKGVTYPKGLYVMPSVISIHRDPEIWSEPNKFMPERWINKADFHPAAFLGFGMGPRKCPGGYLALHEIKILLKTVLSQYRIEKCADTTTEYKFSSPGLIYTYLDQNIKLKLAPL